MQFIDNIDYHFAESDFTFPRMFRARQIFPHDHIADITEAASNAARLFCTAKIRGKRIALTAGSRGVANQAEILKAVIRMLSQAGAYPFIVPGMGSHGGATAEGQREVLAGYGITEQTMGVPVVSCMDVVQLGTTSSGFPVFCDKNAAEADYILPVHRVKPHTDFKGPVESGLCKMMVIGLGKHRGATHIHKLGLSVFAKLIPEAAQVFIHTGKILGGIAFVENAFDETMHIEAITPENIIARETELQRLAKKVMARFYLDYIDLLLIEKIGKDISGAGMDSNITARPVTGEPGFEAPPIKRIALLGISEKSHGNAAGFGMADIVTISFMQQLDLGSTYINGLTGRALEGYRIPFITNNDRDAVRAGIHCAFGADLDAPRVVQITSTMEMSDIMLSEAYLPLVQGDSRFEILSKPEPMMFDKIGKLKRIKD